MKRISLHPRKARLRDLTNLIQYGYTATSSRLHEGPKYLRITDIQNDHVDWERVPRIALSSADFERYQLRLGDIVFARTGATVGKSFLIRDDPGQAVFASYLIRVRCDPALLEPRYAALFFRSDEYWRQIREGSSGTGQPNFNGTKLSELRVPVLPLKEQQRLASKLEAALMQSRDAQEELDKIPNLVARYKKVVLSKAFDGSLTGDSRADWSRVALGTLISSIDAGKNIRCEEHPPSMRECGIVKVSSVSWGSFDPLASKTAPSNVALDPASLIRNGDFLISRANTLELVGACIVVSGLETSNLYLSDKVLRIRFTEPVEEWVLYFLRCPEGRRQIESLATGNQLSMRNISQSALRSIRIPFPTAEVRSQTLVALKTALASITRSLNESLRAHDLLDRFDQATLIKAFRGELIKLPGGNGSVM